MAMLKGLVVGLGVLIVIALGIIAVTVTNRMSGGGKPASTTGTAPSAALGTVRVALPAGARVLETHVEDGRLVLRLARPDGREEVRLYELTTGRAAGTIELDAATVPSR